MTRTGFDEGAIVFLCFFFFSFFFGLDLLQKVHLVGSLTRVEARFLHDFFSALCYPGLTRTCYKRRLSRGLENPAKLRCIMHLTQENHLLPRRGRMHLQQQRKADRDTFPCRTEDLHMFPWPSVSRVFAWLAEQGRATGKAFAWNANRPPNTDSH